MDIPIPNEIEIYFDNANLGISNKRPKTKLDVGGDIKAHNLHLINGKLYNYNDKIILESGSNYISINNENINLNSQKIGVNKLNPNEVLDINGNLKFNGELKGKSGTIISDGTNININPDKNYKNVKTKGNAFFNNNLIISTKDIDVENNSLVVKNKIFDSEGNEFANFNKNYFSINDNDNLKDININGKVNFTGINKGVNISNEYLTDKASGGQLYVDDKIKTKNIEISDNTITFNEGQVNSVKLGKYTNFSNLNNDDQSLLIGHNLYSDDDVKISNTTDLGYRGIVMNSSNGIQFYANNERVTKNYNPKLPNFTISNNGQVIFSIPVLPFEFKLDDVNNEIYVYIREQMSNKIIGSTMTFTTEEYLKDNKVFNVIKNRNTTAKCFIINKLNNNVEKHFDINFSDF